MARLTKRIIGMFIVFFCTLLVLASATLIFSSCKPEPVVEKGFTVTVASYDVTQGDVSVSDPANGDKYIANEQVTVTVTPADGFEVDKFAVDGSIAQLQNGKYVFAITRDVVVEVTFKSIDVPQPTKYFTLVAQCDQGASVKFSPALEQYAEGSTVTMTVICEDGFALEEALSNGNYLLFDGESYTFQVKENVVFTITTREAPSNALLQSLCGSVSFGGTLTSNFLDDDRSSVAPLDVLFDAENRAVWQRMWSGDFLVYSYVLVEQDGKAVTVSHDVDGKVSFAPTGQDFEDVFNPFDELKPRDFALMGEGEWRLLDSDKASRAVWMLAGYRDDVSEFTVIERDGVVSIQIETNIMYNSVGERYTHSFVLNPSQQGSASLPADWFADYAPSADQAQLEQRLNELAQAQSYTVRINSQSSFDTSFSDVVAVQNCIYISEQFDGETDYSGFLDRSDGKAWAFVREDGKLVFEPKALDEYASVAELKAQFDLQGVSLSLFESKGDGVFELRAVDCMTKGRAGEVSGIVGKSLATGSYDKFLWANATAISITLQQDAVVISLSYFDGVGGETLVATFGNFDSAVLPFELTQQDFDGSIPDKFVGMWVDDTYSLRVRVSPDWVFINGIEADSVVFNDGGYDVSWLGYAFRLYFEKDDDVAPKLWDGYETMDMHLRTVDWEALFGEYSGSSGDETCSVVVNEQGVTVTLNGETLHTDSLEYHEDDTLTFIFLLVLNGKYYGLQQWGMELQRLRLYANSGNWEMVVAKEGYAPDWSIYNGTFRDKEGNAEVVISDDGLDITLNGNKCTVSDIQFGQYADKSLGAVYRFNFLLNGEKYILRQNGVTTDKMWLVSDDLSKQYRVIRTTYTPDWSSYVGVYSGKDILGKSYRVEVTQNSILFASGRAEPVSAQDIDVDYYNSADFSRVIFVISFNVNGVYYYLEQYNLDGSKLWLYDDAGKVDIYVCTEDYTSDWSHLIGTYNGEDQNGVKYVVTITATGVTVQRGGRAVAVNLLDYDDFAGFVLVNGSGKHIYLVDLGDRLYLSDEINRVNVYLYRDASEG